jgi:hypothetical protein
LLSEIGEAKGTLTNLRPFTTGTSHDFLQGDAVRVAQPLQQPGPP